MLSSCSKDHTNNNESLNNDLNIPEENELVEEENNNVEENKVIEEVIMSKDEVTQIFLTSLLDRNEDEILNYSSLQSDDLQNIFKEMDKNALKDPLACHMYTEDEDLFYFICDLEEDKSGMISLKTVSEGEETLIEEVDIFPTFEIVWREELLEISEELKNEIVEVTKLPYLELEEYKDKVSVFLHVFARSMNESKHNPDAFLNFFNPEYRRSLGEEYLQELYDYLQYHYVDYWPEDLERVVETITVSSPMENFYDTGHYRELLRDDRDEYFKEIQKEYDFSRIYNHLIFSITYDIFNIELEDEYSYNSYRIKDMRLSPIESLESMAIVDHEIEFPIMRYLSTSEVQFYDGEWKDGKRHGKGYGFYMTNSNKALGYGSSDDQEHSYDGEWRDNKPHGYGILYQYGGSDVIIEVPFYEGEFVNGEFHGKGKIFYYDGETLRYEGEFKDGYPHGKGVQYGDDGEIESKGNFEYGKFVGN